MNQSNKLNAFFYKIKSAFYVLCVLAMTMGIPVLSYIELSHVEEQEKIETVKQETASKNTRTVSIPKYFKI